MRLQLDSRSLVAAAVLILMIGLLYFGWGLPEGDAEENPVPAHNAVECRTCHRMQASKASMSGSADDLSAMPSSRDCLSCHQTSNLTEGKSGPFHSGANANCLTCHSFHHPEKLVIGETTGALAVAIRGVDICLDCHRDSSSPEVSPGHRLAAEIIHSDTTGNFAANPSEFCLSCHNRDGRLPAHASQLEDFPRFHVSATHPFSIELIPGYRKPGSTLKLRDQIPSTVVTIDGKIECQTCHSLISGEKYLLSKGIQAGLCTDCHDMGHDGSDGFAMSSR